MISRDDLALLIVEFLQQKLLVDARATTSQHELATVLVCPLKKCAGDIAEAVRLIDAACFAAGLPLIGTFRVRRPDGSVDAGGLPAAWRERCSELQRRDAHHGWDAADFAALSEELARLAGRSAELAWEQLLREYRGSALTRALRAGRPWEPDTPTLIGFAPTRRPPTWHHWRF